VVQSIGVAILATVLTSALSPDVKALQNQAQSQPQAAAAAPFGICETPGVAPENNLPPAAQVQLNGLPEAQAGAARSQIRAGLQTACDQYVAGFERTYLVTFFAAIVAVVIAAFLPGWPGRWAGRGVMVDAPAARPAAH